MTNELGLCLPHNGSRAAEALELGAFAEQLGYGSVWIGEVASYDAIAVASLLGATTNLRVGTAIVPVQTRTPTLLSMAAATLESAAPGRGMLGLGVSSKPTIEGWHGLSWSPPVKTMAATFDALDRAAAGEHPLGVAQDSDAAGRTDPERVAAMNHFDGPLALPARYIGALGPQMRAFARERADGLVMNFMPRGGLEAVVERERPAGRPYELCLPIRIAVGDDVEQAEQAFRLELAAYFRLPAFLRWLADVGYGELAASFPDVGDAPGIAAGLPAAFVREVGMFGSPESCAEQLEQVRAAGVTPLVVPIVDPRDLDAFRRAAELLAPARP